MKVEIFKKVFETFNTVLHHESNPIIKRRLNSSDSDDNYLSGDEFSINEISDSRKIRPLFIIKKTMKDKESYLENYGNPMATITKIHAMVIVERIGDKVSLKLFNGVRHRMVGNSWFKVSLNVNYITVNTRTGDVYVGYLKEYQKKRKFRKMIRRNFFSNDPINTMNSMIKNIINEFSNDKNIVSNVAMDAISKFMFEVDNRDDFEKLDFNQRLFRFYLNKKQIKYPNNFQVFAKYLVGPEIRKILKRNGNKLVDAFMEKENISGKKLKKSLHNCNRLNIELYQKAREMFGDDWLNQDYEVVIGLLESTINFEGMIPVEFKSLVSTEELRRVYFIFKRVYIDNTLDSWTFRDHLRMYTELRLYGEDDLRWMSYDSKEDFRQEHLDWTDKLQFYKKGNYSRIYPQYFVDLVQTKIGDYKSVLLTNSSEYNEESAIQSNCVKTYITKPASVIISLRDLFNEDRATIEYRLFKVDNKVELKRVQTLGRFNSVLGEEWKEVLFKLDDIVVSSIKDERFETVKITKEIKNGEIFNSDSHWDDDDTLIWSTIKNIESN